MGCVESTFLTGKHRFNKKKSRREFQIPDIVIEEYMSCSLDNLHKCHPEDIVWIKNSVFHRKCPKSEWFVEDCDSITAEYLLRDKPDGTFLVRKSQRRDGHYVLTVCLHYFVHHLLIYKTGDGFGLIEGGVFPTLESLISHYSEVSLKVRNNMLDTKLICGVFQR